MKTAIIGAGPMGLRHAEAARALGLELAAMCDTREDALARAAEKAALPPQALFSSAAELFEKVRPELAIIATNAPSHSEITCLAAESGAAFVLCEKPMATSLTECDRMTETCEANGAKLAINHPARFNALYGRAREIVLSPAFGGLRSMTAVAGNKGLAMNGIHAFEAFRFITGERFAEVSAWFSPDQPPNPRGAEFEDHAGALRAVTASGKRFYLECGADQGHGFTVIYGGKYGQLHANHLTGDIALFMRRPEDRDLPTTRWAMPTTIDNYRVEPVDVVETAKAMLQALISGGDYVDGTAGRLAVEVLVAANLSHESHGAPVQLNGKLPKDRTFSWA